MALESTEPIELIEGQTTGDIGGQYRGERDIGVWSLSSAWSVRGHTMCLIGREGSVP
jgi:hypothetical protein